MTEYRYAADGNLDTIVHPTGLSVRYELDPATGRPTAVRNLTSGATFASEISYLPGGPLSALSFGNGASLTQAFNMRYEPLSIESGPLQLGYTPSLAGDVAAIAKGAELDTFVYDFADRLTARRSTNGVRAEPLDFVYAGGRMVQALDRETGRPRYAYGYDDQASGGNPLSEIIPSGSGWTSLRDYVWLDGRPLAQIEYAGPAGGSPGHVYYVHADHLGTPHALTNAAGQTVWSATVLPYGEVLESVLPDPLSGWMVVTNLRLPGQYDERLLASVGLQGPYYNWNRWYLPGVGRYLEPDPLALNGQFNTRFGVDWYGYAMQNPLRWSDPWGLMSCTYNVREHSLQCTTNTGTPRFRNDGLRSGNDVIPGCRDGCVTSNEDTFWRLNTLLNEDDDNFLIVIEGDP